MRAVRQIATPPSSLCKEPTALLHNIEKKNSQPKRNPAPTPGSIPLRSAPPRRNCKRSAGSIPLDPLNRQHSFCLGAPPLPSCSPTGAVAPLHARSPSRVGGGGRPPRPGTAPTQAGTAAAPKRKAGRLDVVHSPARLESIFRQSLSPERATALLVPHGEPSNPISPAPTTDFAPSRPTRTGRAPAREQASNPKNMSRKIRNKTENTGPILIPARVPNTLKDPPPPPDRSLSNEEKKGRGKKEKSRQAALISKNTVKSRRNIFSRFRVAPA